MTKEKVISKATPTAKDSVDVNEHVYAYLDFFLARDKEPNFAVLVSGSWGIGKTFLVRRYLDRHAAQTGKRYLYVSLYGLATAGEINDAVVEALFPMVARKGIKLAGKLAAAVSKKLLIEIPKVKYSDLVDRFGGMTIVFDDLERCRLGRADVLGFINRYVEHDACSVIILANESEIDGDEYKRVKEKVVGKTLAITPSFGEALGYFIDQIKGVPLRTFLVEHTAQLEGIYQASGTQNLRILFQVLLDYERIWDAVDKGYRSNSEAMATLLRLVAALSFELKSGAIRDEDLKDRRVNWLTVLRGEKGAGLTPWQVVCRKYPTAELQGSLLSDDVLRDMLVRGQVKADEINSCLALSSFFVGATEPAWRILWHSDSRTEEVCAVAFLEFDKQFKTRAFTEAGIVLHAFGLKLWLADMGLGGVDRVGAGTQCRAYLDDLYATDRLEPLQPGRFYSYETGYKGLGFMELETSDFQTLLTEFTERQHQAYIDKMPRAADELLTEMETDPDLFWRRINSNNIGDQLYANTPIFASYDPAAFVDRLLALAPGHQNTVVMAIASRYDDDALNKRLADEKPWLQAVCRILAERSAAMPPFTKHRVQGILRHYLAPKAGIAE